MLFRKIFLAIIVLVFAECFVIGQGRIRLPVKPRQPNIVVIMTDQQSATMLSCAGNKGLRTPVLDRLASQGIRFERAYATNPVCMPSRFSIQTGMFPSVIGVRENDRPIGQSYQEVLQNLKTRSLGNVFKKAGYETFYSGKVHLPMEYSNAEQWGYTVISKDERGSLAEVASNFLLNRKRTDKPFLLFVSFINPHDICYDAISFGDPNSRLAKHTPPDLYDALKKPVGISDKDFFDNYCPPLPLNHQPMVDEPYTVDSLISLRIFRKKTRDEWTDKDWRMHRWAYARLTEKADSLIGKVLNALDKSGIKDSTIVIFTSDHGDNDGSHKLEHKTFFYEEAIRIPLIVSYPWLKVKGRVDNQHMVSNGLDLLPTLCDLIKTDPPQGLHGKSLLPIFENTKQINWPKQIFLENQLGYLIHTVRYKYELDDKNGNKIREVFSDLLVDPGETRNMINDPQYSKIIGELRQQLLDHLEKLNISIILPGR